MTCRLLPVLLMAGLAAGTVVGVQAAPAGAVGRGTYTQITTPSKDLRFNFVVGVGNSFPVSGRTSLDVTSVDLVCVTFIVAQHPQRATMATSVAVTAGQFSTTAFFPSSTPPTTCRLRAIPAGVDVDTDYLGSFTGPIVYPESLAPVKAGSVTYGYTADVSEGDGVAVITDAGNCGVQALVTVEAPQLIAGPIVISCAFALLSADLEPSGTPTRSGVQVDGRNAYLPTGVHDYLIGDRGLTVTQSPLSVSRHIAANGDTTITESATLMRCSVSNTYPPTTTSCPSLVSTGVRFTRVTEVFRLGHQIKLRDSFTSIDHHAHSSAVQYTVEFGNQTGGGGATGDIGYIYPGHSSTFRQSTIGQSVTGLGAKAGTMLVRSDLHARSDDPTANTLAASWSRGPSKVFYSPSSTSPDDSVLPYSVSVPAGGAGRLGFALSERWSTADVKPLAALAIADMLPGVSVTAPHSSAVVRGKKVTVKGTLTAGANGLPTSVTVNGHPATITRHSATSAGYRVTFRESYGRHTITATARDLAGNAKATSITITNKKKKK